MIAGMKGNFSLAVVCWSVGANYELLSPTKWRGAHHQKESGDKSSL
jgi:hypothetical protein